jgi:two-component system response regulator GlrR
MSETRSKGRILVVDDDHRLLRLLSIRFEAAGYRVDTAKSGKAALGRLAAARPELAIVDLRMDDMDGMTLFELIRERHPTLPVVILTAHGTISNAVEATKRGISAYITKPFDSAELLARAERLIRLGGGSGEGDAADDDEWRRGIIGHSRATEEVLEQVKVVAQTDTSVLLLGASGTGKELVARAMHAASTRRVGPFVAVNCAAIPEPLFEAELFGHGAGAFTGAEKGRRGLFEEAHGGTLLLDEIGDMPLAVQAKLLRAIEGREFRPVGSTRVVTADVRIVSATHSNLEKAIAQGEFREDLYYRLNVITLEIATLSERREDIPLLVRHFLANAREGSSVAVSGFSPEAMELLMAAPWPGNVRQLRNVVEQCRVLSTSPVVPASLVRKALRREPAGRLLPFTEARDQFELDYLSRALEMTQGNVTQAARLAGRNRSEFYKLLRRHELMPEAFRAQGEGEPNE